MMLLIFVFLLFQQVLGYSLNTQEEWKSLEQDQLDAFLVPFRESVLQQIAVGWNKTIKDSALLKVKMQKCSEEIKATVESCKTCAANTCQQQRQSVSHSPTFTDYLNVALNLANPVQYLKEPLNEIGDRFSDLIDLLGSGSDSFIDSMSALGNSAGGAFKDAFHGVEYGFNSIKDQLASLGNSVASGIKDAGNSIGDGLNNAGNAISHAGHSVIHSIGSIFGRKRAVVSPEIRACMIPCLVCNPLLMPDQRNMISAVCGADVVKFNDTVRANVKMIKGMFTAISDKVNPVITKIEFCPESQVGVTYTSIYVTANVKGRYLRYKSSVTYDMMNMGSSARNVATEFWKKWTE
ncbi:uncharacterized protein LOC132718132 isoform X1 [Ruditapes philippinarum]|uniref:uncharacterized protein LOC132718132 isoform X1 n=1 Tax=Ruditapes philippinarum TaxID=129788 RepID=UPI00295B530E|nr:uncharacterized protein LOC132718132 isoform X1 [Ruditapes philippinarum]